MVDGGFYHTLALRDDGTVWGWGNGQYGQLGDGAPVGFATTPVQVKIKGGDGALVPLTNVTAVDAGDGYYSLALKEDGTVWAWGNNNYGQLGNGTITQSSTPAQVLGEAGVGVKAIAAGSNHSIALKEDGTVWAWGANSEGQLGIGSNDWTSHPTPAQVKGLSGVIALTTGNHYSLALKEDGTVWAWGNNTYGQLGDGTYTSRHAPVQATNLSGMTVLVARGYHALGFESDGSVWAWGHNSLGQLGDGTHGVDRRIPVQMKGKDGDNLGGVTALAGGYRYSLALQKDGTVLAWGINEWGQLGNGTYDDPSNPPPYPPFPHPIPTQVLDSDGEVFTGVTALALGYSSSLVIRNGCEVWGWGWNDHGQLGNNKRGQAAAINPTPVQALGGETGDEYFSLCYTAPETAPPLAAGGFHSLALKEGKVLSWGKNNDGQLGNGTNKRSITPAEVKNLTDVTAIAAGIYHSLALEDGEVFSWGRNNYGQLGNGTNKKSLIPVNVKDEAGNLTGVTAIAAGCSHSIALKEGEVFSWGRNNNGQLGNGTKTSSRIPVKVKELTDVTAIVAGGDHNLALKDGEVFSWGRNDFGQLGDGTTARRYIPVKVKGLPDIKAIAIGYFHSLALDNNGTVWAWGRNNNGQLGNGTTKRSLVPIEVKDETGSSLTGVTAITAGCSHSLAVTGDGVLAWGRNNYGQLGTGTTKRSLIPVKVKDETGKGNLTDVTAIVAGGDHVLALNDDKVWAWGRNSSGQLGNGTTKRSLVPVEVKD
jgi:alpha-tubulin suppressor-like RCC1 family protein